jgi:hypothetical protein
VRKVDSLGSVGEVILTHAPGRPALDSAVGWRQAFGAVPDDGNGTGALGLEEEESCSRTS